MNRIRTDFNRQRLAAQQVAYNSFNTPASVVGQAMPKTPQCAAPVDITPSPTPQVAAPILDVPMGVAPETPHLLQPYRPAPRAPRARINPNDRPTPVIQPKRLPRPPKAKPEAPPTPVVPLRVNIGNGTPSPARTRSPTDAIHIPVPRYLTPSKSRSKSQGKELIPGPLTSITEGGTRRGRTTVRKPRGSAAGASISSSVKEAVPTKTRAVSIASSAARSSRSTSIVPPAASAAASSSSRSRSKSVAYVGPASSSGAAAAAPADRPDVPTKLSKQSIPSKITNPQVLVEVTMAVSNGVLKGEDLQNYQDIMAGQEYVANAGYPKMRPAIYKDHKAICARGVWNKTPPEAS